tara:strand:+ start:489 stop:719 length:231 start_codon:yes stop_codon:yes gene_type:complete
MKAINPKNQSIVNKAVNWLEKHNKADDLRNIADSDGNEKEFKKYDKECENTFNKYLEYMSELPKNQQKAIEISDLY